MKDLVIYKLTNTIDGKIYIGQTRDYAARMNQHKHSCNNQSAWYIGNAIGKYGWETFVSEIIDDSAKDLDELNQLEKYYIDLYKSDDPAVGYNLAKGGDSNVMDSPSIKEHHDRIMRSEHVRSKISATMKNNLSSPEIRKVYSERLREGFKKYLESDKFKQDSKNRHLSPEHYKALNDAKNKSVYCIDELGNIVAEFPRVKDAAKWWWSNGYNTVKDYDQLNDKIKESYKFDKYIKGLKWIYRV